MIKHVSLFLLFQLLINWSFGQSVYRVNNKAYKANKFTREFYVLKDSTCYLKEHYADNSTYSLYKGRLEKINDTVALFRYQPLVEFGCQMRWTNGDSLNIELKQVDTILPSFNYRLKMNEKEFPIDIQLGTGTYYLKGFYDKKYVIDTKFRDPLNAKTIGVTVGETSEPTLTYYGSKTVFQSVPVSISENKLLIYPDGKHFFEKETYVLITR